MATILANKDNDKINQLFNQTVAKNQPILLTRKARNAILITE
jgi:PHD/YefM family antitoxin component YafN of YafNO toxin-antitoxin module